MIQKRPVKERAEKIWAQERYKTLLQVLEGLEKEDAQTLTYVNRRRLIGATQLVTDIVRSSQWKQ
jgi:hypothetical protein